MTTPDESHREHPSTYFVQDRSSEEEMNRLRIQDQMITAAMGGALPDQPDPGIFHRVLDIGCGSGSWVLEMAQTYPDMSIFGVDISKLMVDAARSQAVSQGVADRVEFHVMDALRMLEFPDNYFDLVNLRASISWMRKWDWPKMISEMQRVTRPGGVVRITEPDLSQSSSPALTQFCDMLQCALFKAGHLFEQNTTGLSAHIAPLLTQHGVQHVQTQIYVLKYEMGTPQGQAFYEDVVHSFRTMRPFIKKWGCLSPDYDAICQQAISEIQQSDFYVTWNFFTSWGKVPLRKEQRPPMAEHH